MSRRAEPLLRSTARSGRLIPKRADGLRAGAVVLRPAERMPWHSTRHLEELLIVLEGEVELHVRRARTVARTPLAAGRSAFLRPQTDHQVVNRSPRLARYVYVTAPAPRARR